MSFAEALDRFQAEETKTAIATSPHPSALQPDTGGFSFLTKADAALTYPPLRYSFIAMPEPPGTIIPSMKP